MREVQKCDAKFELHKPINTPFGFHIGHKAQRTWQSKQRLFPLSVLREWYPVMRKTVLACSCNLLKTFLYYCNLQHLTDFSKIINSFTG